MKKHVGIDVSKKCFDLHILEDQQDRHFEYTAAQISKCVKWLKKEEVALIVLEATGGYEVELAAALQGGGLPVAVVNPRRIRDFAKAVGRMAKTDKLDARIIAQYGATVQPRESSQIDENSRILKGLVARRNQLIEMKTAESNRREHAFDKTVRRSIETIVGMLEKEIEKVEEQLRARIDSQPELKQKAEILDSAPGIGSTTAFLLVVEFPELGRANKKEIAALLGVAPMNRDSGMFRGKRMTGGGRRGVRSRLYMPVLSAIRYNPVIRKFYRHLLEEGKKKMTAVVAAMRKLVVILNTMVKNNQTWSRKTA